MHSVIGWWARTCALADLWEMPSNRDPNETPREKSSLAGAGNRLINTQMPGPRPCDQTQEQAEVDGEASSPVLTPRRTAQDSSLLSPSAPNFWPVHLPWERKECASPHSFSGQLTKGKFKEHAP